MGRLTLMYYYDLSVIILNVLEYIYYKSGDNNRTLYTLNGNHLEGNTYSFIYIRINKKLQKLLLLYYLYLTDIFSYV